MDWKGPSFQLLLKTLFEGAYVLDPMRRIVAWNAAAEEVTGMTAEEMVGRFCHEDQLEHVDSSGCILCQSECPVALTLRDGQPREQEVFLRHRDGYRVPVRVRSLALTDGNGKVDAVLETFTQIQPHRRLEERLQDLERLARADSLTGIGNRRHLDETISIRLEQWRRFGWRFGILFVDLDDFKGVNDAYGHPVGDRLLVASARTLVANLRPEDVAARVGGEEFVAVVGGVDLARLREIADRFRRLLRGAWLKVDGHRVRVTASVGVTMATPEDTRESLLQRADALMYRGKRSGKDCVVVG